MGISIEKIIAGINEIKYWAGGIKAVSIAYSFSLNGNG
jgi:hypothetical protein